MSCAVIREMTYAGRYADADEAARRNYRGRVALGFFVLAFLGFASAHYGDLGAEFAYVWIASVLVALPTVWTLESALGERLGATDTAPAARREAGGDALSGGACGVVEAYIDSCAAAELRTLHAVETPDGEFDHLLIHRDGRVLLIQRSRCGAAGADAAGVDSEAADLQLAANRVSHVLGGIPGGDCDVRALLVVPDQVAVDYARLPGSVIPVAESRFREAAAALPSASAGNAIVFQDYRKLRSLIRG